MLLDLLEDSAPHVGQVRFLSKPRCDVAMSELWRQSERGAAWLRHEVGTGGRVAAVLVSSRAALCTILAAFRSGVTFGSLPLPARGMGFEEYQAQIEGLCTDLGCDLLLVGDAYVPLIPELSVRVETFERCAEGAAGPVPSTPGMLVQFTSGSTGNPKGIVLTMDALGANVSSIIDAIGCHPTDRTVFSWLPLSHDMGLVGVCLSSLCVGAEPWGAKDGLLALMEPRDFVRRPESWLATLSELRANVTAIPPFALDLANRTRHRLGAAPDLSSLRVCITGAEPVSADVLRTFEAAFAPHGLNPVAISPAYGLAEATVAVTLVPPEEHWTSRVVDLAALAEGDWAPPGGGPVVELVGAGRAVACAELQIAGDPIGEIQVRGASMLSSYLGQGTPLSPEGWFSTKDLGAVVDDELFVIGRTDDMFTVAGRNFFAHAIEATAASTHEAISLDSVAVVAHDGGYVVVAEHRGGTEQAMHQAARLARLELVRTFGLGPREVRFVAPGQIPKTPSGKLRRLHLRSQLDVIEPVWSTQLKA